jgi:hypothetical protein
MLQKIKTRFFLLLENQTSNSDSAAHAGFPATARISRIFKSNLELSNSNGILLPLNEP